jgi:hypothetical protein
MTITTINHLASDQLAASRSQSSLMNLDNRVLSSRRESGSEVLFALGQSNVRQRAELGWGTEESQDPKGCVLRQLRLDRNVDPAVLATWACVSVKLMAQIRCAAFANIFSRQDFKWQRGFFLFSKKWQIR